MTYATSNIFHSILVNRHKFHFCIVRELSISHRMSTVRTKLQSIQGCNDIEMIRRFHLVHNRDCKQLESNHDQPSADHKHMTQFRDRNVRDLNSLVSIDKLVGLVFRNLLLAIQLCRSIDLIRNFHVQSKKDLGNRLWRNKKAFSNFQN